MNDSNQSVFETLTKKIKSVFHAVFIVPIQGDLMKDKIDQFIVSSWQVIMYYIAVVALIQVVVQVSDGDFGTSRAYVPTTLEYVSSQEIISAPRDLNSRDYVYYMRPDGIFGTDLYVIDLRSGETSSILTRDNAWKYWLTIPFILYIAISGLFFLWRPRNEVAE